MKSFETWWSHYESQFSEPLGPWDEDLAKEVWNAAIEATAAHIRPFNIEFIDDVSDAILEDLKTS